MGLGKKLKKGLKKTVKAVGNLISSPVKLVGAAVTGNKKKMKKELKRTALLAASVATGGTAAPVAVAADATMLQKDGDKKYRDLRKTLGDAGVNWKNGSYDIDKMSKEDVKKAKKIWDEKRKNGMRMTGEMNDLYGQLKQASDAYDDEDRAMEYQKEYEAAMLKAYSDAAAAQEQQANTMYNQALYREESEKKIGDAYRQTMDDGYSQAQRRGILSLTRWGDAGSSTSKSSYLGV